MKVRLKKWDEKWDEKWKRGRGNGIGNERDIEEMG